MKIEVLQDIHPPNNAEMMFASTERCLHPRAELLVHPQGTPWSFSLYTVLFHRSRRGSNFSKLLQSTFPSILSVRKAELIVLVR